MPNVRKSLLKEIHLLFGTEFFLKMERSRNLLRLQKVV